MINKEQLIEEHKNTPFVIGENVNFVDKFGKKRNGVIKKINHDVSKALVHVYESNFNDTLDVSKLQKTYHNIGYQPFIEKNGRYEPRSFAFSLESILDSLGLGDDVYRTTIIDNVSVKKSNLNPFIFDVNGEKVFYQRPFVWGLEDMQLLIESIYNGIDCGKILIRHRSWEEIVSLIKSGETHLGFRDVVDGKQRLLTIHKFVTNQFPDLNGYYYRDFSDVAKNKFIRHQLFSYSEFETTVPDSVIKEQFLKMNFLGVKQSKEHLDFVKSIKL